MNAPATEWAPLSERTQQVYAEVFENPGISPTAIAYNLDLPRYQVNESLEQLRMRGLVTRSGNRRGAAYEVPTEPTPELPPRERIDACPRCGGPVRRDGLDNEAGWCIDHGTVTLFAPLAPTEVRAISNITEGRRRPT